MTTRAECPSANSKALILGANRKLVGPTLIQKFDSSPTSTRTTSGSFVATISHRARVEVNPKRVSEDEKKFEAKDIDWQGNRL